MLRTGHYEAVSSSVDVYPTLAELAGIELPASMNLFGISLADAARGTSPEPERLSYSHTSTLGPARVKRYHREGYALVSEALPEAAPEYMWARVRAGDMIWESRYVPGKGRQQLAFDLSSDPFRVRNVFDPTDSLDRERMDQVQVYLARLTANYTETSALSQKEILKTLASLGYASGEEEDE